MLDQELCVFLEQITPGIRDDASYPGESMQSIFSKLKSLSLTDGQKELEALLKVIEQFNKLPNQALIEINSIFERDVMHFRSVQANHKLSSNNR